MQRPSRSGTCAASSLRQTCGIADISPARPDFPIMSTNPPQASGSDGDEPSTVTGDPVHRRLVRHLVVPDALTRDEPPY
ncbi:hypothetical protein GCM10017691_42640 [Pseudonocardia petroleophila]